MAKKKTSTKVTNSEDLNTMLSDLLVDVRNGIVDTEVARSVAMVAAKLNRNNMSAIEYKRVTKHENPIKFFETA